jgi:hypothetical protein
MHASDGPTLETSASARPRVLFTRTVAGVAVRRVAITRERILGAHLVGPDAAHPEHLLLHLDEGFVSFPCAGQAARAAIALVEP